MALPKKIKLADDQEIWTQQKPHETAHRYGLFQTYLRLRRGRTHAKVAEEHGLAVSTIDKVASAFRWTERAHAWDASNDTVIRSELLDEEIQTLQGLHRLVRAWLGKVFARLQTLDPQKLTAREAIDASRMVAECLRMEVGLADVVLAAERLGLGQADALSTDLAEFEALTPPERKERLIQLTREAEAFAFALSGTDDD